MSSRPRFELNPTKVLILAGPASLEDLASVEALLCRHPGCSAVPFRTSLLESLTDLSELSETLIPECRSDELARTWKRILRIELGAGLLRAISKVLSRMPGNTLIVRSPGLSGLEQYASFFPGIRVILAVSESRNMASAEELAIRIRSRGHPVLVLGVEAFRKHESAATQVFDFANLAPHEVENGA